MRFARWIALCVVLFSFILAIYLLPKMPSVMASHWNTQGEVDAHVPKFLGLFLMPIISLVVFLLFIIIPKIDPLKRNIRKFRPYYDGFILLLLLFLLYIYLLSVFWNLGYKFDMTRFFMPAIGVLVFYCGVLIKHAKRNWFIGIRTPWTLSSDRVWKKTHDLGAKLFMLAGVLCFVGVLLPRLAVWFVLVPILFAALFTIIYSYVLYQRKL